MKWIIRALLSSGMAAVVAAPALAQAGPYPVHRLDFGIWCTEQQHLPYERCEKRLPDDVKKFEAYRAVIERYEIPYLQEKDKTLRFYQNIMHNDPVDRKPDNPNKQPPGPNDGR